MPRPSDSEKNIWLKAPFQTSGWAMPARSGVKRYITPSVPPGSVTPRMISTIMNSHINGTATRTVFSMVSVPFSSAISVMPQIAITAIIGHQEERMPKKYAVALGPVLGSRNGANGAVAPPSISPNSAPTIMQKAQPRIVM